MNSERHPLYAGRGFPRRLVELPCELVTATLDSPTLAWGADLSESGIFLETEESLIPGEAVVVAFRPTFGWSSHELLLFAEVARTSAGRRRGDRSPGAGLRFLDLGRTERLALTRWLRPRPRSAAGVRRSRVEVVLPSHPFAARVC